jgi:hypothetical protein
LADDSLPMTTVIDWAMMEAERLHWRWVWFAGDTIGVVNVHGFVVAY